MKIIPPLTFETTRLVLRAARSEDAADIFQQYTGNDAAARYLQRSAHSSPDQTRAIMEAWGASAWLNNSRFAWTIFRSDLSPIGLFLMFIQDRIAEIHYGIGPSQWGKGFATEAGRAIMDWAASNSKLSEVTTCCAAEHIASMRVLEKIGLRRTQFLPAHLALPKTMTKVDAWLYRWEQPSDRGERFT